MVFNEELRGKNCILPTLVCQPYPPAIKFPPAPPPPPIYNYKSLFAPVSERNSTETWSASHISFTLSKLGPNIQKPTYFFIFRISLTECYSPYIFLANFFFIQILLHSSPNTFYDLLNSFHSSSKFFFITHPILFILYSMPFIHHPILFILYSMSFIPHPILLIIYLISFISQPKQNSL